MDSNKETKFSIQYGPKDILDKKFKNKVLVMIRMKSMNS
ncbi:cell division protein GpsB [Lacticaseibacillus rhamnosus MTCC 5462]|nr:cell division protein GpsB [Lacticaseibacillus rhamnosus MTCC 5462]